MNQNLEEISRSLDYNNFDERTRIFLSELSYQYPNIDSVVAKIASLKALLTLPKGTVHVISDIHGEFKKLRHVINNGSGSLRPLVEQLFLKRLSQAEIVNLLNIIYYPLESFLHVEETLATAEQRKEFIRKTVVFELEIVRELMKRFALDQAERLFPDPYQGIIRELVFAPQLERGVEFTHSIVDQFLDQGKEIDLLRLLARLIRNMSVEEIIVAGDLGDRGNRIDRVISYLTRQPRVSITWGNHDAAWMGACLGSDVCIATVLRISLRYRRLLQLEEGYGISLTALENLANTVYGNDPATRFPCKSDGLKDSLLVARMQKAIAIIQFKLEGRVSRRNPSFDLEHRNLLHCIDPSSNTVLIDGQKHELLDSNFPTIDWSDPYKLSPEEESCMARFRESFLQSPIMWQQMKFVDQHGSMYLIRDGALIFHACLPVDQSGEFLSLQVDGKERSGKALFDALNIVVHRSFREKREPDLDMLWYLWSGPRSPWFGKDKMTTFESYFVADKSTHKETKNAYFRLIHEVSFCRKILSEFGVNQENGLIVNGHVPVKIEEGESPLKKSGQAVTIDGAFSEAYGDNGYTLILDSKRRSLALHHHFGSIADAITQGTDIVPTIQDISRFPLERSVNDTEQGDEIRHHIDLLELLGKAYRESVIPSRG